MNRLHPNKLDQLKPDIQQPAYVRRALKPGIVHLGLGAFHRAHQAAFTEQAMANSGGDWGIIGVSMRSDTVARQLLPQQCLYSLMDEDSGGYSLRVIGALCDVLVAPREPERVISAIANPAIKVITLTITEKGYALAADGCSLDIAGSIRRDLKNPEQPESAIGLLALGLRARHRQGAAPLSIISCDNLAENSLRLRGVLRDYLALSFPKVLPWLKENVTFPCSMVDRIVPAMQSEKRQRQSERLGFIDEAAVSTEPFRQWIIENKFAAGIPDWNSAGAQLVEDVRPYEEIKLRLLNAAHSAIAYVGLLSGMETVDQFMSDETLKRFVESLMTGELMPALATPQAFDLPGYRDQLLQRFRNPCLHHRCSQIAMDGSEKIPQRWVVTLQSGTQTPLLRKALSCWLYFVLETDLAIDDPQSERLLELRASGGAIEQRIAAALSCARIDGNVISDFSDFCQELCANMIRLEEGGIAALLSPSARVAPGPGL